MNKSPEVEHWKTSAKTLVELFYPLAEVAIYNAKYTLVAVENPLSKKTPKVLELPDTSPYTRTLEDGRQVKSSMIPIHNGKNQTVGYALISFDTSLFKNIQSKLDLLLHMEPKVATESWKDKIQHEIQNFLKARHLNLEAATRSQKRELILSLFEQGMFDYKDASKHIALLLNTSRATIYNYLNWATTMKKVQIHQVDAFTNTQFGGNPAGVVLDAASLSDDTMRKITREMNLSETAFVLPSDQGDFRIRYFTPSGDEVKFCGHSTVGALHMMAREGRYGIKDPGTYTFGVETKAGLLRMEATIQKDETIIVSYDAPKIELVPASFDHETLCQVLGISIDRVDRSKPVMLEKTNGDVFLTIKSLKDLENIQCDFRSLTAFSKEMDIVGVCLLTTECFDPNNHVHARGYAPVVGIPEDPFTGSMQGGLAAYLHHNGMIPKEIKTIGSEQGHFIGRPGTVKISLQHKKGTYYAKIHAQAVHFFSTEVNLV